MCPTWTDRPPDTRDFAAVPLCRVPAAGQIVGVITSKTIIGCYTHWDRYRTQPCAGQVPPTPPDPNWRACPLCHEGQPTRWHGWLSLFSQMSQRQAVLQLTALAAHSLLSQCERYGSLRGILASFSRVAKRPNARIMIETRQLTQPLDNLPEEINIQKYMSLIWQSTRDLQQPDKKPDRRPKS